MDGLVGLFDGVAQHRGRVDTSAQQNAHGHVTYHVRLNGPAKEVAKLFDRITEVRPVRGHFEV